MIVGEDTFSVHIDVTGRPPYEQVSWSLPDSVVLAEDLNAMLHRLGWRDCPDWHPSPQGLAAASNESR